MSVMSQCQLLGVPGACAPERVQWISPHSMKQKHFFCKVEQCGSNTIVLLGESLNKVRWRELIDYI